MIAGQGERARDGQEEQETDRATMHAHSKAAGQSLETLDRTHTDVSVYFTWKRDTGSV